MVTTLYPIGFLGSANFERREISIPSEIRGLPLEERELKRLTDLGEKCIETAQVIDGENAKRRLKEIGMDIIGEDDEGIPQCWATVSWSCGIIGGLEIYASRLCDGPRLTEVIYRENSVFMYDCDEKIDYTPINPKILMYVPGEWEKKVYEFWEATRKRKEQRIIL